MAVTHPRRLPPRALLLLLSALFFTACPKDPGTETLAQSRARYAELLEQGTSPDDPRFHALIAELDAIPEDSDAAPEAQRLIAAIRGAQRGPPMRPLAPVAPDAPPTSPEEARLREIQRACGRLAEQLGASAPGDSQDRLREALQRCREQVERAKVTHLHPGEAPPGEDAHAHDDHDHDHPTTAPAAPPDAGSGTEAGR